MNCTKDKWKGIGPFQDYKWKGIGLFLDCAKDKQKGTGPYQDCTKDKWKGERWCTGPYLDSAVCCDRCADITDKCECTGPYLDSVV